MNTLRLEHINRSSPYRIRMRDDRPGFYYFRTDFGVEFSISIKHDDSIVPSGAYALDIINVEHRPSPSDPKFRETLLAIIEEFFEQNNEVMLYITETGDEKQASRNRLFVRWFNSYEHHDLYYIRTAEGTMEGQQNFMAIFSRRDNPRLPLVLKEFDETIALLFD